MQAGLARLTCTAVLQLARTGLASLQGEQGPAKELCSLLRWGQSQMLMTDAGGDACETSLCG